MDYTTLPVSAAGKTTPETRAFTSLYEALQALSDARREQRKRYSLALILCLVVLARAFHF